MPIEKEKNGVFFQKKLILKRILEVIKNNPGIKVDKLVAKLNVNDPFLNEQTAETFLKNLFKDEQIKIDKDDKVFLC